MTFEEMRRAGTVVPILGGYIWDDMNPPEAVTWAGEVRNQRRADDLLQELLSDLRDSARLGKVASKVVEVETEVGLGGYGGETRRPVVYVPEDDTMYIGSSNSSHASVIAAIDENILKLFPDTRGYSSDGR